ncbi:MAG: DUF3048 domain-containing protein [Candidatus Komeilibacteria bacterium]|nr:DUF3048 domain-containing protein [Candidatus Komeilibacteria bacterium]
MLNKFQCPKKRRSHGGSLARLAGVFLLLIAAAYFLGRGWWHNTDNGFSLGFTQTESAASASDIFTSGQDYPVIVMIDNSPEAQPYHSGLAEALVVYETLAEGGSTRLEALFAGAPQAERIGPVRSARPYFVQIAADWGAFYWHAGGSPEGLALIKELAGQKQLTDLNEISGLGPIYLWRDTSLAAPHNLFTGGAKIGKALADFELTNLPADKLVWQWEKDGSDKKVKKQAESAQGAAVSLAITFSPGMTFNPGYIYDAEAGVYKRSLAGRMHRDFNTKEQLAGSNIIVQKVPAEWSLPSGYDRIDINIVGEGEALFFRDGQVFAGQWKKESAAGQTEWFLNDKPFILKRGQTWVEIVPGEREVKYN